MAGVSELSLTARLNRSAADARRGVVRLHSEALAALGLREWDGISVIGSRRTAAVAGRAPADTPAGVALLDDVTLSNAGIRESSAVVVAPVPVRGAKQISVTGSAAAMHAVAETTLRQALLGKVVTVGDTVSLLPRDLGPGTSSAATTQALSRTFAIAWTSELLTVTATDPTGGPVSVQPNSAVVWGAAAPSAVASHDPRGPAEPNDPGTRVQVRERPSAVAVTDLAGVRAPAAKLSEWLSLALDEPELLRTLGASPNLGVLITGPAGAGKATLARAVSTPRRIVELDGPTVGACESGTRLREVALAVSEIGSGAGGVLLITDIDALLPKNPDPVATLILDQLRAAVSSPTVAFLATTSDPAGTDSRLRAPDLCDREVTLTLPTAEIRGELLRQLLRSVPTDDLVDTGIDEVAARTPGFVVSDLAALCREAALRAASRASHEHTEPILTQPDLLGALEVIRPLSRSGAEELAIGTLSLDDVGDMTETKQALTETVLWPLRHPDSFARLGIDPPRGVLLYGPPGCGKTFLVRALAGTGQLSVHAVKGAELMDKWVGSSERAVRELFQRARDSAPSLIFLDEIDALAPRRGQSGDSGVGDRVVAALLTELDGVEPLRDVVVVGATNRPELIDPALLRPARLERLVFVPPPDAEGRRDILRTASRNVPLGGEVDLDALAGELDGYSAADCSALLREAAMAAMRRNVDAAEITPRDLATARERVRPSLDREQVESLRDYANRRAES